MSPISGALQGTDDFMLWVVVPQLWDGESLRIADFSVYGEQVGIGV